MKNGLEEKTLRDIIEFLGEAETATVMFAAEEKDGTKRKYTITVE